jgi:hypothetical protein
VRHDGVHESDALGFARVHELAGEQQAPHRGRSEQLPEPLETGERIHQPESCRRDAEACARRGETQIARCGQFQCTADRMALECRQGRHSAVSHCAHAAFEGMRMHDCRIGVEQLGGDLVDGVAGAPRAAAPAQNGDARLVFRRFQCQR